MLTKLGTTISTLLITTLWASEAFAACYAGIGDCGGATPAPEIDGAGALAVMAVVLSVGVILYRKVRG